MTDPQDETPDLDAIDSEPRPDPELHELADAVESEADADAGADPGHDAHGHDTDDAHDGHGEHDEHPAEDPRWVLAPLLVGAVIGLIVLVLVGMASGAPPFA